MRLPPEGARWLVSLRWVACTAVFVLTFIAHNVLRVLVNPVPMYLIGGVIASYNVLFAVGQR